MSKANGSGGDDLQSAFPLDDEEAPDQPNGAARTAASEKGGTRGKRISANAKPSDAAQPASAKASTEPTSESEAPAVDTQPAPAALAEDAADAADDAAPGTAEDTAPAEEAQGARVMRYVNDASGCYRELEDGSRESLSEDEWTSALAQHFKRETPASG